MLKDIKYRWAIIVLVLIAAAYLIWPTYTFFTMSKDKKEKLSVIAVKELTNDAIKLGLDLQGGMYVLLEVDIPKLVEKLSNKRPPELKEIIQKAEKKSINEQSEFFNELLEISNSSDIQLMRYYTNLEIGRAHV